MKIILKQTASFMSASPETLVYDYPVTKLTWRPKAFTQIGHFANCGYCINLDVEPRHLTIVPFIARNDENLEEVVEEFLSEVNNFIKNDEELLFERKFDLPYGSQIFTLTK